MEVQRIPFPSIPQLSSRDVAYATQDPALRPFYQYTAKLTSFSDVIADRNRHPVDRSTLVAALQEQYAQLTGTDTALSQINQLSNSTTFTVTTAHQPSLFTGPLYFIYKIASTINLSRRLKKAYPDYHFVPIFITGGEDHDFEEINHLHLYGKRLSWDIDAGGAVGALPSNSLQKVLQELKEVLGESDKAQAIFSELERAYTGHASYSMSTIAYTHHLFGQEGLVILDMNRPSLKKLFLPIMKEELLQQPSQAYVEKAQVALEEAGFSGQAHAREINLFYLREGLRERIEQVDGQFRVLNTNYSFTEEEILHELEEHPERFSPNVIMRPLYQETVLPNLAYIGGGGEIAYWLERKEQFKHFGVNFPMLIRRNSVLWLDRGTVKRMDKLGLGISDLFEETHLLVKRFVTDQTENELSLSDEKKQLEALFTSIAKKARETDPTLEKAVLAEHARQLKAVENLEGRLMRAEKQKYEVAINQIEGLKDKLFPGNGLQERHDNLLSLYLRYGRDLFATLLEELNPLEEGFIVVVDRP